MAVAPDGVEALRQVLLADSGVEAVTAGLVFDRELPYAQDFLMPVKCVVIRPAGGPPGPATLPFQILRMNTVCYGETPHLAGAVLGTVYMALSNLTASSWAGTLIMSCQSASGEIALRDPDEHWPYSLMSWQLRIGVDP
jgi:hypothetical protein